MEVAARTNWTHYQQQQHGLDSAFRKEENRTKEMATTPSYTIKISWATLKWTKVKIASQNAQLLMQSIWIWQLGMWSEWLGKGPDHQSNCRCQTVTFLFLINNFVKQYAWSNNINVDFSLSNRANPILREYQYQYQYQYHFQLPSSHPHLFVR